MKKFFDVATSLSPVTDKVTVHACECLVCAHRSVEKMCARGFIALLAAPDETMYGLFVVPLRYAKHRPRFLEIGLGCGMAYGPGASLPVWQMCDGEGRRVSLSDM